MADHLKIIRNTGTNKHLHLVTYTHIIAYTGQIQMWEAFRSYHHSGNIGEKLTSIAVSLTISLMVYAVSRV